MPFNEFSKLNTNELRLDNFTILLINQTFKKIISISMFDKPIVS